LPTINLETACFSCVKLIWWVQVQRIVPKDPDALKKLRECEKAVAKIRFEEAIAMEEHDRHSVAESLDFHSIGNFCWLCFSGND